MSVNHFAIELPIHVFSQRKAAQRLLDDFAAAVPTLQTRHDGDQLMGGKLLLALELVRSLEQHDISTPSGNLVDVLIKGKLMYPSQNRASLLNTYGNGSLVKRRILLYVKVSF